MKHSKYWLLVIAAFLILALDFAAFDDITTGTEPNYLGEAAIIILSIPTLTGLYFFAKTTSQSKLSPFYETKILSTQFDL